MYLAPEGQELEIANAAQDFLADVMPIGRLHGPDQAGLTNDARRKLAEMGWFGLAVGEAEGGSGLSEIEHVLFFREVGRNCGSLSILATCLAALATCNPELRAALLSGETGAALIVADGDNYRLVGDRDAGIGVLASRQGARLHGLASTDAHDRSALDRTDPMRLCAALPDAIEHSVDDRIWMLGQLATAAMLIGIAEAALDLIVEYAKVRETFGRKIGAWQAVRHPAADMAVRLEAARAQLWFAAAACKERRADAAAHLDAAKHLTNEAALRNADSNIQLHGGIGVTEEHAAHLLLKRALLLSRLFGARRELLDALLHAGLEH